jgi:beta-lactamase class A
MALMPTTPRTTQVAPHALAGTGKCAALSAFLTLSAWMAILLPLGAVASCAPSSPATANGQRSPTAPAQTRTPAIEHLSTPAALGGLEALSPELASYVAQQGDAMGVAIYDLTRGQWYSYHGDGSFVLASSSKVYILCAYLDMLERQGRAPNATDRAQMTAMITQSDNNAAQWLFDRIGRVTGQDQYLQRLGITGYVGSGRDWGYARLSANAMVRMLMLLQTGQTLNSDDRALALDLLGRVDVGRWGVGDTAPPGAKVYMKDGWVTGPDDLWYQSSSGIVAASDETYIVSVYLRQARYDWSKIQHVCAQVAQLLA